MTHRQNAGLICIFISIAVILGNPWWFPFSNAPSNHMLMRIVGLCISFYLWLLVRYILTTQFLYTRANILIILFLLLRTIDFAWRLSSIYIDLAEIVIGLLLGVSLMQLKHVGGFAFRCIGVLCILKTSLFISLMFFTRLMDPIYDDILWVITLLFVIILAVFLFSRNTLSQQTSTGEFPEKTTA
jgi:hypothetical protein